MHQRIDPGIAGQGHKTTYAFTPEIGDRKLGRSEQQVGPGVDCNPIFFLGPWQIWIVGPQASLNMRCGYAGRLGRQEAAESARRIALNDDKIRQVRKVRCKGGDDLLHVTVGIGLA